MKQYLDQQQTAKLIELEFEKPKSERWVLDVANESTPSIQNVVKCQDYSIGELMEMLPQHIFPNGRCFDFHICANQNLWVVKYMAVLYETDYRFCSTELIDALYDMILRLKEKGVI